MNHHEALVGLNLAGDIGSIRLHRLIEYFGKPQNIFSSSRQQLVSVAGIGEKIAERLLSVKKQEIDNEFLSAQKQRLKITTLDDPDYPENLKTIPDPPLVLYIKGEIQDIDKFSISIVGSRHASMYGLTCAEKFAAELSQRGFTIISGMARGIDAASHRGALKVRGRTIAVMGSGFNHIYPHENIGLAEEICANGAVISEFPINMKPLRQNFPRRNRIVSGLGLGVLVIEAARNSGALITADFALEQGKDVFALPGKVDSATSCGTNALIQQGAKLASNTDDILEELIVPMQSRIQDKCAAVNSARTAGAQCPAEKSGSMSDEEKELYSLITVETVHLDDLIDKTKLDISRISDILLRLELKKLITQLPGKQFVRN